MSKKRIAVSTLVVLVAVIINILITNYTMPLKTSELTIKITLNSDKENGIQLYYLTGPQKPENGFLQKQVVEKNYKKVNQEQTLTYVVPGDTSYIRIDIGQGESDTKIMGIQIAGKEIQKDIPVKSIVETIGAHDVSLMTEEGLEILASGDDPYCIWSIEEWNAEEVLSAEDSITVKACKIALCVAIDLIFLYILICAKKFAVIPKELWQNRKLIFQLAKNDFKTKYAGSYLGIIWAFVQPIVTVLVYWFVFQKGLKSGGVNTSAGISVPFVLWLVAGLVPWFFFSDALNGGTNALIEYSYLVKKVVFKISILPIVKVLSALFVHLFFIVFTLCLYAGYHYYPDLYTLQVIYYSFCTFVFVLGLSYATCAMVGFFRDLTQIIGIFLQVGVWMTPIMWNIDTMELPTVLIRIFKLNPMYYVVAGYRDALINKVWFWEEPSLTLYFWVITVALFGIGMVIFKRLKVHFADVL